MEKYDSTQDTKDHIAKVASLILNVVDKLDVRCWIHDKSKLEEPEKEMYDEFTPLLKDLTYGSDEYRETLRKMGDAVKHHYEVNSHHPEHYENGINGMTLIDVVEMLCDWKAASLRHSDGSILDSLVINKERFKISDQLFEILKNTIIEMGW